MRTTNFIVSCFIMSMFGSMISPSAPAAAAKGDATLNGIATAANAVGALPDDPQSLMFNYLKTHLYAAAQRLATVCDMTKLNYSGVASDSGVIIGVENNTNSNFMVMQNNVMIGKVAPGWNDSIVLNLAALSDTTVAPLNSFTFVPVSGPQQSQLVVRVMTGTQLFNHISNLAKRESVSTLVSWYKNGTNPLPGAGDMTALASDLYLVVENEKISALSAFSPAAKRLHVLNLSNLANLYTVSLSINSMGLAEINNNVSSEGQLGSLYSISIQGVHILNEVPAHTIPLLVMPRNVYQAGSSVNSSYASYIQAYASALGNSYAGTAPEYYDLWINCPHEPFGYLKTLKYFDLDSSMRAVVDKTATLPSGQIIGSMILTDVYGAYTQDISPDISWVACNQSGFDTTNYDHILFGVVSAKELNQIKKIEAKKASPKVAQKSKVPFFIRNLYQNMSYYQPNPSVYDQQSPLSYSGFPMTNISVALMEPSTNNQSGVHHSTNFYRVHIETTSSMDQYAPTYWVHSFLSDGAPNDFTSGQSYNQPGSFPSPWYNLTYGEWKAGIKMVPVFYRVNDCTPYTSMEKFKAVSAQDMSALYFYSFNEMTGEFMGLVPAYNGGSSTQMNTYTVSTPYMYFQRNNTFDRGTLQSPDYDNYGVAKPGQKGLVGISQCDLEFPGCLYFTKHPQTDNVIAIRNKWKDITKVTEIINQAWKTKNLLGGSWLIAAPMAAANNQIIIEVLPAGANTYNITLYDQNSNILGFQAINAPAGATELVVGHLSTTGAITAATKGISLGSKTSYFKLIDTPSSGILLIPSTAPAGLSGSASAKNVDQSDSVADAALIKQNKDLKKENAKLRKEVQGLKAALAAQG